MRPNRIEIEWSPETEQALRDVLKELRAFPRADLTDPMRIALEMQRERGLVEEALVGLRRVLERCQAPVIDLEVLGAVEGLRLTVGGAGE